MPKTLEQPEGLMVKFSLSQLSDADIRFLLCMFTGKLGDHCSALACWVIERLSDENLRRVYASRGDLRETSLPFLNAIHWTNADHADALVACHAARAAADGHPVASKFLCRLELIIIVWAGVRLRSR